MPLTITSLQNPRIKQALRLRDRSGRQEQMRLIVDGWRETCRALQSQIQPLELYVCESLLTPTQARELSTLSVPHGLEWTYVSPHVFEKLSYGQRGEGVVLVAAQPTTTLADLTLSGAAVVAVLEQVEKPGNLGAVVRTADAAGISAVIVLGGGTDLFNPNAIRASLGALFHVPVCAAEATATLAWLRNRQTRIFAARVDGAVSYTQVEYTSRCAIVLGSEAHGLSDTWVGEDIQSIALPMRGIVDSLNVSATAAILFYEALRQRRC
jgi:TrmH family RNA methyltransferase